MKRGSPETQRKCKRGFTLIELLVVVAIIALLISILLPSLNEAREQARTVVCNSNMKQVGQGLINYQEEWEGSLPQSVWSEAAWWVAKKDLWFYKLVPTFCGNPKVFVCPSDPYRTKFDFEAKSSTGLERVNTRVPSCGYGLTYIVRHFTTDLNKKNLWNTWTNPPRWPERTILTAEVGPDNELVEAPLYAPGTGNVAFGYPWRDGGRLLWDDGARPWYDGPTWLTARHRGYIHLSALDGSTKKVYTRDMLNMTIQSLYRANSPLGDCYGLVRGETNPRRQYICAICKESFGAGATPHYNFSRNNMWWWTGPLPERDGWR
ncbi:MAG: DUF1559 domain-containing protein [Phycisphaerae bacterium]|nr:DUF1559 domain-containing protein [Phycisphaerae bacterium]